MKKILNSKIFVFLFGVAFTSLSIVFAASYLATDVGFTSVDANWKASNVSVALDDLYIKECKSTPVGEIISFMGTVIPDYYLECDGTVYDINAYPTLAEHIKTNFGSYDFFGGNGTTTFAVPDLRGEFLRGRGTNSHTNQGSGANVGVHQDATAHIAVYSANTIGQTIYWPPNMHTYNADSSIGKTPNTYGNATGSIGNNATIDQYITSRPTNTSVVYLIRYR